MDEDLFSPFRASIHPEINCLWRGQSLLIADHHGEITGRGLNGYFFRSVRYLQKTRALHKRQTPPFLLCIYKLPGHYRMLDDLSGGA